MQGRIQSQIYWKSGSMKMAANRGHTTLVVLMVQGSSPVSPSSPHPNPKRVPPRFYSNLVILYSVTASRAHVLLDKSVGWQVGRLVATIPWLLLLPALTLSCPSISRMSLCRIDRLPKRESGPGDIGSTSDKVPRSFFLNRKFCKLRQQASTSSQFCLCKSTGVYGVLYSRVF